MKKLLFFSLLILIVGTGCRNVFGKRIQGNGHSASQERNVGSFNSVNVSGAVDVVISQGAEHAVRIDGDDNLLEYMEIKTGGNTLYIDTKRGYNLKPVKQIRVFVTSPEFKKLDASGACNIKSENQIVSSNNIKIDLSGASDIDMDVVAPSIDAEMSGAGSVKLKGKTKSLDVSGSGSSDIKCKELMAENVKVRISGAGDAEVFASMKLDVRVSGAGSVKYLGNPTVSKNISGAGSVKKMD